MKNNLREYRPLTDSLDLVRGSCAVVSDAVCTEVRQFTKGDRLNVERVQTSCVTEIFESVQTFANVPLTYFILPTRSPWSVLWFDSFLCDGYDSLCWCLTKNYGFETMHMRSSDVDSRALRGSSFTHRQRIDGQLNERSVYCSVADAGRWHFEAHGKPLIAEDLAAYTARRIADRPNERSMEDFLGRLGAFPWASEFYALPDETVSVVRRQSYPATIITRNRAEIFHD